MISPSLTPRHLPPIATTGADKAIENLEFAEEELEETDRYATESGVDIRAASSER